MTDTSDDTTSNIDPRACALPLVALEPSEICPRCDLPAGAHRRHPSNSPKPQALDPLALAREVASLRSQLEIAHKFHDLVVKERDLERLRVDRLTAELADALRADANDEAYAATLIREKNTAIEELRSIKLRASAALTWAVEPAYHNGQALRAVDEVVRVLERLREANAALVRGAPVIAAPKLAEFKSLANVLAKISVYADTYGEDLVPRGKWTDSFGDGVRSAKSAIRALLDTVEDPPTPPAPALTEAEVRALPEPSTRAGELALRVAAASKREGS